MTSPCCQYLCPATFGRLTLHPLQQMDDRWSNLIFLPAPYSTPADTHQINGALRIYLGAYYFTIFFLDPSILCAIDFSGVLIFLVLCRRPFSLIPFLPVSLLFPCLFLLQALVSGTFQLRTLSSRPVAPICASDLSSITRSSRTAPMWRQALFIQPTRYPSCVI